MLPLTISILISTMDERIARIPSILLPPVNDINYIICHQSDTPVRIPKSLKKRDDVTIIRKKKRGLSASRNVAIKYGTGDLLILADDDIELRPEYLRKLQRLAEAHPETDIFSLQALTPEGKKLHYYPRFHFTYPNMPRGFYFCSMGLVLRWGNFYPKFDTRFGLGSDRLHMGEEDVFLHQCHKAGLRIDYYPQPLLITEGTTTSLRYAQDPNLQQAKGAMLTLIHGTPMALLRFISTAVKMQRQVPLFKHFHNLIKGMKYIKTHEATP